MDQEAELKAAKREFFNVVLKHLNSMLEDKEYLVTEETFSAVDVAYYNEIKGV